MARKQHIFLLSGQTMNSFGVSASVLFDNELIDFAPDLNHKRFTSFIKLNKDIRASVFKGYKCRKCLIIPGSLTECSCALTECCFYVFTQFQNNLFIKIYVDKILLFSFLNVL